VLNVCTCLNDDTFVPCSRYVSAPVTYSVLHNTGFSLLIHLKDVINDAWREFVLKKEKVAGKCRKLTSSLLLPFFWYYLV
jgi:hypothetical protein